MLLDKIRSEINRIKAMVEDRPNWDVIQNMVKVIKNDLIDLGEPPLGSLEAYELLDLRAEVDVLPLSDAECVAFGGDYSVRRCKTLLGMIPDTIDLVYYATCENGQYRFFLDFCNTEIAEHVDGGWIFIGDYEQHEEIEETGITPQGIVDAAEKCGFVNNFQQLKRPN